VNKEFRGKAAWWTLLAVICTHFCLAYIQNCKPFLRLGEYEQGLSHLPYQQRVLMAWVLSAGLKLPGLWRISAHLPTPLSDPGMLILFAASWLSLFGSVLFTWRSLARLTRDEEYSRWASLLVVYMAYFHFPLAFGLNFFLPYDLPSLLFFCGCIYSVVSGRVQLFYLFFIIGSFNRETICMATLFLVIWRWHERKGRMGIFLLTGQVLTQAALWLAIRLYLHHRFAGNVPDTADASFYYKLSYNFRTIVKPQQWPVLLSVFGFTLPLTLAWRKWIKNPAVERELFLLPVWFAVMMLVGVIIEIRIFSELISYMALVVGLILYHRFPALRSEPHELIFDGSQLLSEARQGLER
jgi:hypothetical protein